MGGGNKFPVIMHQKEHLRDNAVSVNQSQQHLLVGRSNVFSLGGGGYSTHQQQQHGPINGVASYYIPTNHQHLHFPGIEALFMDQELKSTKATQSVADLRGGNEFLVNIHQKEHLHDNAVPVMQSQQHLPVGRSNLFSSGGGRYSSYQQHAPINGVASYIPTNTQDLQIHGSEASNSVEESYDELLQQFLARPFSPFRDQGLNSTEATQSVAADRFGLPGLSNVINMNNPDLTHLSLGIDLMSLGLNLNAPDNLYDKFSSPWADESTNGEPRYAIPECYNTNQPLPLNQDKFSRFSLETLFYIFYSMPKDKSQLFAANELYNRGWFYHRNQCLWFLRDPNMQLHLKTSTFMMGCFYRFDPNTWEIVRKDPFVILYEMVEDRPVVPRG